MKCRIIYKPDETVAVIHAAKKAQKPGETEEDFLERVFAKAITGTDFEGLPFDDIEPDELPDRKDRAKWRGTKEIGVKVDPTIVTKAEKRQAIEDELDAELEKEEPDLKLVAKLQRRLAKKEY